MICRAYSAEGRSTGSKVVLLNHWYERLYREQHVNFPGALARPIEEGANEDKTKREEEKKKKKGKGERAIAPSLPSLSLPKGPYKCSALDL